VFSIVIIAGGKGERFWPKSVMTKPKQFHKIISDRTMIQETFFRVYPEIKKENIFIVAGERFGSIILEQLPLIKKSNLIVEPEGKNTAPAIGLAAVYLYKKDPEDIMAVLSADHVVEPREKFIKALNTAVLSAEKGNLVTFGITPERPATEYGYIETGQKLQGDFELNVYRVKMFREKPSFEQALKFVEDGSFLWNAGLFTFKVKSILNAIKEYMPSLYSGLMKIYNSIGAEDENSVKKYEFERFNNISIDYGIMEKAGNIVCVKPDFLWDDVGSWGAVARHRNADNEGNVVQGNVIMIDSKNNIVVGEDNSVISLVGISDTIVVKEGDKILISLRSKDQKVKEVLKVLSRNKKYLKYR